MDRITDRAGGRLRVPAALTLSCLWCLPAPDALGQGSAADPAPAAIARFDGVASPGLRITLSADRSTGADLHYRWIQTQGAPATLDRLDGREASLSVPEGADPLGFLLVVGNARGVASTSLTIPVEAPAGARDPMLRADAGDDLVGYVGRQVTLNGVRSEPRGRIGYRWIQAGGPQLALKLESGCYYTFVPAAAGTYQFALVVASGDRISDPDYVTVAIAPEATQPTQAPIPAQATPAAAPKPAAPAPPPVPTVELTRLAARSIDGGAELAPELAKVFSDIAGRMDLFKSYEEAFSEMSRRLDDLVPRAPERRAAWTEKLFVPLTLRMVENLRAEGLDLARPEGQSATLSTTQRRRLAGHFRSMAEGFGRASEEPSGPQRLDVRSGRRSARDAMGPSEEPK